MLYGIERGKKVVDQEKYERLKNAIRVFSTRTSVSDGQWYELSDDPRFRESVLRRSALELGEKLLEDGLLEIQEWCEKDGSPYGGSHVIQVRVEVLLRDAKQGHFTAQLDQARRDGIAEAAAIVREIAGKYSTLRSHGHAQALALDGAADALLEKSKGPLK